MIKWFENKKQSDPVVKKNGFGPKQNLKSETSKNKNEKTVPAQKKTGKRGQPRKKENNILEMQEKKNVKTILSQTKLLSLLLCKNIPCSSNCSRRRCHADVRNNCSDGKKICLDENNNCSDENKSFKRKHKSDQKQKCLEEIKTV